MPSTLPFMELFRGLGKNILKALRYWLHYLMVAIAWLGVVPLTACKYAKNTFEFTSKITSSDNTMILFSHCILFCVSSCGYTSPCKSLRKPDAPYLPYSHFLQTAKIAFFVRVLDDNGSKWQKTIKAYMK